MKPSRTWEIVLAGAASLLVELTVIRYLPGQVRVLGYFTNFVLLAAFVGLGVGMLAARRWLLAERIMWSAPLGLLALVGFARLARAVRVLGSGGEVLFLEYQSRSFAIGLRSWRCLM